MMIDDVDLSGLMPALIGFICFLLSLLFWFVWPKTKAKPYSKRISWPGYILHYFHPLAWVLLGMAAFFQARFPILGWGLAALGGIVYIIFIVMLVKA
jgi:hypothetical protein